MKIVVAFFFLCAITNGYTQEVKTVRDVGVWASVGFQYRFNKKWSTGFSQEFRLFDNASKINKVISDAGVTYSITNQFRIGGNVRYAHARKKDNLFTDDIRYNLDFMYKKNLGKHFQLKYRLRYQNNFINLSSYSKEFTRKAHARNQFELNYNRNLHTFYITSELFREYVIYRRPYFNSLRTGIGDQIKTKRGVFDYSLCYELELNETHPFHFFFLRLDYTLKFKK